MAKKDKAPKVRNLVAKHASMHRASTEVDRKLEDKKNPPKPCFSEFEDPEDHWTPSDGDQ